MQGFFSKEQLKPKNTTQRKGVSCATCGLYKRARTPKMEPYGEFKKRIMVIGSHPSEQDDLVARPWQGEQDKILRQTYKQLGISIFEDCICLNAVNCKPVNKRGEVYEPTAQEITYCRQKVLSAVKKYKPRVIILHGEQAVSSLLGHKTRGKVEGIFKWQGWAIPDAEYNAWVCPTFHPSFVEKMEERKETRLLWEKDLERAFNLARECTPLPHVEENVIIVDDMEIVVEEMLKERSSLMAFDIETTGLKPYDTSKHRIVSISFCNSLNKAYAMLFPTERRQMKLLKKLLVNRNIGKIAANMKYEDTWLNVLHGIRVRPWAFDTMQAAHILDNRMGITGLKFQAYVQFGVIGYEDEVAPYIKSSDSNGVNKIDELIKTEQGMQTLLHYNGMDSLLEYRLAMKQMKELGVSWSSK